MLITAVIFDLYQGAKVEAKKLTKSETDEENQLAGTEDGRKHLSNALEQIVLRRRHEDNMMNSRLQALLVTTAFLVSAFAQFREPSGWLMRLVVALVGTGLGLSMLWVLRRTRQRLKEYREDISRLEKILIPYPSLRPFSSYPPSPKNSSTNDVLGVWIPKGVVYFWPALLLASLL